MAEDFQESLCTTKLTDELFQHWKSHLKACMEVLDGYNPTWIWNEFEFDRQIIDYV